MRKRKIAVKWRSKKKGRKGEKRGGIYGNRRWSIVGRKKRRKKGGKERRKKKRRIRIQSMSWVRRSVGRRG